MEWSMLAELVEPNMMVVVAACWAVGFALKTTPKVPDWSIVYIVTLVALGLSVWLSGFTPDAVIQGILSGAFAVYGHQLVKQATRKE